MFVTITGDRVQVTLSRRNLRQLHDVLENTDGYNKYLVRRDESGLLMVVHVEDDDDHYDERTATGAAAITATRSNGNERRSAAKRGGRQNALTT
jgi:hypothetical protein